jgi:hypothetical protein
MNDVQSLHTSAQQAVKDSNGHPLAKYHSFGTLPALSLKISANDDGSL